MNKLLLMGASGESHIRCLQLSSLVAKCYAEKHGYDFCVVNSKRWEVEARGRPLAWAKIPLIFSKLQEYDSVFWLDCDCIIIDDSVDISEQIPENKLLSLAFDDNGLNSGCFFIKKHEQTLRLLNTVWGCTYCINHPWWEQKALMDIVELKADLSYNEEKIPFIHKMDSEWNTTILPDCYTRVKGITKPIIKHWVTGSNYGDRYSGMLQDVQQLIQQNSPK